MIKDTKAWQAWEDEYIRSTPVDFRRNLATVDAMFEHAKTLAVLPTADPLEGLEHKIGLSRALNPLQTPRKDPP